MQSIRPGRASAVRGGRPPEAILRDQLAHLVAERYDQLEVIATVALGKRKAHALLPALRSGSTTSTRSEAPEPAANEPAEASPERVAAPATA